jgi:hypothetical protein
LRIGRIVLGKKDDCWNPVRESAVNSHRSITRMMDPLAFADARINRRRILVQAYLGRLIYVKGNTVAMG